jgi:hypothetical protein
MVAANETEAKLVLALEDKASRTLAATGGTMDKWGDTQQKKLAQAGTAWETWERRVKVAIAAAFSAAALKAAWNYYDALGAQADALANLSTVTDLSVEKLQELEYIEQQNSIAAGSLAQAHVYLARQIHAAAVKETPDLVAAFERLGLSLRDSAGNLRDSGAVFNDLSAALGQIPSSTERTALAMKLLGESTGKDVLPVILKGKEYLTGMADEARALGRVMSKDTVAKLDKMGDAMTRAKLAIESIGRMIAVEFAGEVETGSKALLKFATSGQSAVGEFVRSARDNLGSLIEAIGVMALGARKAFDAVTIRQDELKNRLKQVGSLPMRALTAAAGAIGAEGAEDVAKAFAADDAKIAAARAARLALYERLADDWTALADKIRGRAAAPHAPEPNWGDDFGGWPGEEEPAAAAPTPKGRKSTRAEDAALARLEREKTAILERVRTRHMGELELLDARHQAEAAKWKDHDDVLLALDEEYEDKRAALKRTMRAADIKATAQGFGALSDLALNFGKTGIKAGKAFGIAEAIINTHAGATAALRLPWPKSLWAMAQVLAAGMRQVSAIRSVSDNPSGGASGGASGGIGGGDTSAGPTAPREPEALPPSATAQPTGRVLKIEVDNFYGNREWIRNELAPAIKDAFGDGVDFGGVELHG